MKRLVFVYDKEKKEYRAAIIHLSKKDICKLYGLKIKA
jgi:hypothetical protein